MDSLNLLARENEFKKLNQQLEKKTESLMRQIENVMQKQDVFTEYSPKLCIDTAKQRLPKHHCNSLRNSKPNSASSDICSDKNNANNKQSSIKNNSIRKTQKEYTLHSNESCDSTENLSSERIVCHNCTFHRNQRVNEDLQFLYAFVSVNVKDKVLPQSYLKDRVTVESVCKFLSAKVKLMQEQLDKMQKTIDKQVQQCEAHLTQLAELEGERMKLLNRANNASSEAGDIRAKYSQLQSKFNEKDSLYKEQRSNVDKLVTELKQVKVKEARLEARCASQEETLCTLRQQLETIKLSEKECRDSTRNLSASHQNVISRQEARIKQLTSTIDKQNSLIDNLKRQIALLTTEGALEALEKEYSDFLKQEF